MTTDTTELRIGDRVEIRFIQMFRGDKWIPAIIERIDRTKIVVRAVKEPFDAEGEIYMALALSERNRQWR